MKHSNGGVLCIPFDKPVRQWRVVESVQLGVATVLIFRCLYITVQEFNDLQDRESSVVPLPARMDMN
jgi:hypothetical protein